MRRLRSQAINSAAPSWAKDFLESQDPTTSPERLSSLREQYENAISQHQQRQAASILKAIARNPNAPKDELAHLSIYYYGEVACNPALARLALESPSWAKENLSVELLRLALPELYQQQQEEMLQRRRHAAAQWDGDDPDDEDDPRYGGESEGTR